MPTAPDGSSLRLRVEPLDVDEGEFLQISVKGRLPDCAYHKDIDFVVSLFDCSGSRDLAILSAEPFLQEIYTPVYQSRENVRDSYPRARVISSWLPIGGFMPDFLIGPHWGSRNIRVVVRLVDVIHDVEIMVGEVVDGFDGLLWTGEMTFQCFLRMEGYTETASRHRRLESVALRLALAVAVADGELDTKEIDVFRDRIKWWMANSRFNFDGLDKKRRSTSYRGMLSRALSRAKENKTFDTDRLLKRLDKDASPYLWRELLDLCYEVMSANGIAHADQLRLIRKITDNANLDAKEIAKFREHKMLEFEIKTQATSATDEFLGIDTNWDIPKIRKHLRSEYKKWNGRLNTIPEGKARENAQSILNMIGEAYKKYTLPKPAPGADQTLPAASRTEEPPEDNPTPPEDYWTQLDLFRNLG